MKKIVTLIIRILAKAFNINLQDLSYQMRGIALSNEMEENGEAWFLRDFLKSKISGDPTIFDVGANLGLYSTLVSEFFFSGERHLFEPNPLCFEKLKEIFVGDENLKMNNIALGAESGTAELFVDSQNETTGHASLEKEAIGLHGYEKLISKEVKVSTLDEYCKKHKIGKIDFLKIDTEGFELEVLKGGGDLLTNGAIKIIQFEFNEMNIARRVFMNDFYKLLPSYDFYRLKSNSLYPLGSYSSNIEIFKIQNIIAIRRVDISENS
jgi:FkbM family methyltransferase